MIVGGKSTMKETVNYPHKKKLKEYAEAFRKMKQGKYGNKNPSGGGEKTLVNVEDA